MKVKPQRKNENWNGLSIFRFYENIKNLEIENRNSREKKKVIKRKWIKTHKNITKVSKKNVFLKTTF